MAHFKVAVTLCLFGVVVLSPASHQVAASGLATSYSQGGLINAYGGLGNYALVGGLGTYDLGGSIGGNKLYSVASGLGYGVGGTGQDDYAHPKYAYKYGVSDGHTGDFKDAQEHRNGGITTGEYSLLQADGRKRTVQYTATSHGGFNAHVSYSGHAIHPQNYQKNYLSNTWQ